MNSEKYIRSMVKRVVEYAEKKNISMPDRKKSYTLLPSSYHPELDVRDAAHGRFNNISRVYWNVTLGM